VISTAFGDRKKFVGAYVGATRAIAGVEAVDVAGNVTKSEIAKLDAGVVWPFGAAGISLIDICLVAVSHCYRLTLGLWAWQLT
jgi:hypothetical protein